MLASKDRPAKPQHLLYLHGFRSSPRSAKAQRMARWVSSQGRDLSWHCPQLPPSPAEAMALIEGLIQAIPAGSLAVMGSSLGGFYASCVAQRRADARVVLLNPAVDPARDLARHIGEHSCWQTPEERFFFRAEYVEELRALQHGPHTAPQRLLAVIAKGDEVLDWREMQARHQDSHIKLLEGSDHGLSDFDDYLHELVEFLQL